MNSSPGPTPSGSSPFYVGGSLRLCLAAALAASLFGGCESAPDRPRHRRVVERSDPPPPIRIIEHNHDREPNVVVVRESPSPSSSLMIVVGTPPPRSRREVMPHRPSRNHVWLEGHWRYERGNYTWVPGHWETPPRERATYVAPRWEHRREGHVFVEGYWKN